MGNLNAAYKMVKQGALILQELDADEEYILSAALLAELATSESQMDEAKRFIEAHSIVTLFSISRLA